MQYRNVFSASISLMIFSSLLIIFLSCQSCSQKKSETPETIMLSEYTATLPYGEGVNLVEGNCGICHSNQYINMQPAFPKATWEKIVDKMIHNFGAPVSDSASRNAIVKYLVDIRGID